MGPRAEIAVEQNHRRALLRALLCAWAPNMPHHLAVAAWRRFAFARGMDTRDAFRRGFTG